MELVEVRRAESMSYTPAAPPRGAVIERFENDEL